MSNHGSSRNQVELTAEEKKQKAFADLRAIMDAKKKKKAMQTSSYVPTHVPAQSYDRAHVIKRIVISPGGTRREVDYNKGDGSSVD